MTTMFLATHGGHIDELVGLAERIEHEDEAIWVTTPHPQTERLSADRDVRFVPIIESNDWSGVLKAIPGAFASLRRERVNRVISTGSAIALAYLPTAALMRIPVHYIESSARVTAPSKTGRFLSRIPGVTLWWQFPEAPDGWTSLSGVFDAFRIVPREARRDVRRVLVTVGTTDYCFRRLVERLVEIIPDDVEVVWQVGKSNVEGLGIDGHDQLSKNDLDTYIAEFDVVISHAGSGSLLTCLSAGVVPVLVPRLGSLDEQNDDHQLVLASWAGKSGLAVVSDASEVAWSDLETAANLQAITAPASTIELT